jgi:O-antigen ligase
MRTMAQTAMRTGSYRAPRLAAVSSDLVALGGMALLAAALGWGVVRFDGFGGDTASAALATVGGLACLAAITAGPLVCLAAIAALTAGGFYPVFAQFGGVEATLADVFFAGLFGWWLLGAIRRTERGLRDTRPRIAFGQGAAILFLACAGLTVAKLAISDPGTLGDSLASWLRLVQTASLAWLAASVIETKRDVRLVLGAIAGAGVVAVAIGALTGGNLLTQRSGGTLGPNPLGLVSGVVLLIAAFGGLTSKARYRIGLAAIGLLGLLLAKSVASFVATGFVLALGASLASTSPATASQRATRVVLAVAMAGVLVFSVVQFLRPDATPTSESFRSSSASQRIILGAAGLEVFERNPVLGAGWRLSSSPEVIGDREIAVEVRRRFPHAQPNFYPDVSPGSVHNTYVQILADTGLVGFAVFVALIVTVALRVRELLRRLGREHELWPQAWVMSLCLLLVLIWLNDNPLYGGQPETVLLALLVGTLAAVARMTSPVSTSVPDRETATTPAVVAPHRPAHRARAGTEAPPIRPRPVEAPSRTMRFPTPPAAEPTTAAAAAGTPSGGMATARAEPGARPPARKWPSVWPETGRRLALAAGIVAVAGAVGLLAGRWTADEEPTTGVGPDRVEPAVAEYGKTLSRETEQLDAARASQLERLREARTPGEQARASEGLASVYQRSASFLAGISAPGSMEGSNDSLVAALRRVAGAYRQLAAGAANRDKRGYETARRAVQRAEATLRQRLAASMGAVGGGSQ